MEIITDFPERLQARTEVFVGPVHQRMVIENVRPHGEGLLIKFVGVQSPEEAARYRNKQVYVRTADRPPLPEGQYYDHELLGFAVVDADTDEVIGSLTEIMRTGANDVYVVGRPGGNEVLLPVIASVVLGLDMSRRQIRVRLLPGLIEDQGS